MKKSLFSSGLKTYWGVFFRLAIALTIGLYSHNLRYNLAGVLPIDSDEDTYLNAAMFYADSLRKGKWTMVAWYDQNIQHPPLSKLSFTPGLLQVHPADRLSPKDIPYNIPVYQTEGALWIIAARRTAALYGGLTAFVLALFSPAAGLFFGIQSTSLRFTSEVYLEPFPVLTGLLCILFYHLWKNKALSPPVEPHRNWWYLAVSSFFLGATAAGKYMYAWVGIAIILDYFLHIWTQKIRLDKSIPMMVAWGLGSFAFFFLLNPTIWVYTWQRFYDSVSFHFRYAASDDVRGSGRGWWYILYLLWRSIPDNYPALKGYFFFELDWLIFILGITGLVPLWIRRRTFFVWTVSSLIFLLFWPTKWDQYILLVLPGICLSAGYLFESSIKYLYKQLSHSRSPKRILGKYDHHQ